MNGAAGALGLCEFVVAGAAEVLGAIGWGEEAWYTVLTGADCGAVFINWELLLFITLCTVTGVADVFVKLPYVMGGIVKLFCETIFGSIVYKTR